MWDVSQRELEKLWNQLEKEKEKEREREENERAGELLESGSKEKEKGEDVLIDNGIRVWWTKCKRKRKKKKCMDERKAKN